MSKILIPKGLSVDEKDKLKSYLGAVMPEVVLATTEAKQRSWEVGQLVTEDKQGFSNVYHWFVITEIEFTENNRGQMVPGFTVVRLQDGSEYKKMHASYFRPIPPEYLGKLRTKQTTL